MMQLALGRTYRVTFKPEFVTHGYQKPTTENPEPTYLHDGQGVVIIAAMLSFNDVVASGISLYESFFKPCGISEEEYREYFDGKPEDIPDASGEDENGNPVIVAGRTFSTVSYANFPVYKCVDAINQGDVFYVPQEAMASFPEVDINLYFKLMMTVDFGTWEDVSQLQNVEQTIKEQLNLFGISTAAMDMVTYGAEYMTTLEYQELDATRQPEGTVRVALTAENIDDYVNTYLVLGSDGTMVKLTVDNQATYIGKTVNLVALNSSFATNYFLRWKIAEQENLELKSRVAYLEELVIQQSQP